VHCVALLWQKEANDKSDISCKRAKLASMQYYDSLTQFFFLRRMSVSAQNGLKLEHAILSEFNNSNVDGLSHVSFWQQRVE